MALATRARVDKDMAQEQAGAKAHATRVEGPEDFLRAFNGSVDAAAGAAIAVFVAGVGPVNARAALWTELRRVDLRGCGGDEVGQVCAGVGGDVRAVAVEESGAAGVGELGVRHGGLRFAGEQDCKLVAVQVEA